MCRIAQLIVSYRQVRAQAVERLLVLGGQARSGRSDAAEDADRCILAQERQVALLDGIIAQHDQDQRPTASMPARVP